MKKILFIFACILSLKCNNIIADEEQTNTEKALPEYMEYIPAKLFLCDQRPIRGCTELLNQFFCAYKLCTENLTEGERQLCNQISNEAEIYDGEDSRRASLVKIIVEANSSARPEPSWGYNKSSSSVKKTHATSHKKR